MSQIGVTGLAVMGANLARNIARRGVPIAVHNRTASKMQDFMGEFASEGDFTGAATLEEFVEALARRREQECTENGLRFIGTGVSGGEEGALNGPSVMPGGPRAAYGEVEEIFTTIAAQVDGEPCCAYIGPDGAGHYVKMVHNGIEYADMQLIAEAYDLLRHGAGLGAAQIAAIFDGWNSGD